MVSSSSTQIPFLSYTLYSQQVLYFNQSCGECWSSFATTRRCFETCLKTTTNFLTSSNYELMKMKVSLKIMKRIGNGFFSVIQLAIKTRGLESMKQLSFKCLQDHFSCQEVEKNFPPSPPLEIKYCYEDTVCSFIYAKSYSSSSVYIATQTMWNKLIIMN